MDEFNAKFKNINNINMDDFSNLSDAVLRDIFDDIDFTNKKIDIAENNNDICPKCFKSNCIVHDSIHSTLVCTNCGQVTENLVDQNPEWRQFEDGVKSAESRCSIPVSRLLPQSSLGTNIAGNFRSRLKTLHTWSQMPYKERSLMAVFKIIQGKCQEGGIVKCIEEDAKIMYKAISECKHFAGKNKGKFIIIRGKNRQSLIAACLFFSCKKNGKTRSPKEIADLFNLKFTEITKGCKNFLKLMKIRKLGINIGTSQPEHFVARFCNELKIRRQYIDQAVRISKNIRKLNIATVHTPFSTATSSILLMAEINDLRSISKKKLSNKFKVSEVTITKTYKKIEQYKKILIDDKLTDKLVEIIKKNKEASKIPDSILERFKKFDIKIDTKDDKDNKENNKENIKENINKDNKNNKTNEMNNLEYSYDESEYELFDNLDDFEETDEREELNNQNSQNKLELHNRICTNLLSNKLTIYDNLDEYVNNLNLDIYEQIAATEREYITCVQ